MNASFWAEWDLPGLMQQEYQPWLGSANLAVVDASTRDPVAGAVVTVMYGNTTHVTRKVTDQAGGMAFDGWSGKSQPPQTHSVSVSHPEYTVASDALQLPAGDTLNVTIPLTRAAL